MRGSEEDEADGAWPGAYDQKEISVRTERFFFCFVLFFTLKSIKTQLCFIWKDHTVK